MGTAQLRRALTDSGDLRLRLLPERAAALLEDVSAPPRLAAHLCVVHDVAWQLTDVLARSHPELAVDRTAVLFGAATHDIGKTIYVEELSGPGSANEEAGYGLLRRHGVEDGLARFAWTHAAWTAPTTTIEDLLVSLADKIWKAKRVTDLETMVVDRLAAVSGRDRWQEFLDLDDLLDQIAADADRRLAFQASHPLTVTPTH